MGLLMGMQLHMLDTGGNVPSVIQPGQIFQDVLHSLLSLKLFDREEIQSLILFLSMLGMLEGKIHIEHICRDRCPLV
jgi:hypothetical protein